MHRYRKLNLPGASMPERAHRTASRHTAKPPDTPARVEEIRLPLSRVDTNAPSKRKRKDLRRAVLTDPSRVGKPPRKQPQPRPKAILPRRTGQEQAVDNFSLPRVLTGRRKADVLDDDDDEVQPTLRAPDMVPQSPKTKTKRIKVDIEVDPAIRQRIAKLNLNSPVKPRRRIHRESKLAKELKDFRKRMSKIPIVPQPESERYDFVYTFPEIVTATPPQQAQFIPQHMQQSQQIATSSIAATQSTSPPRRPRTKKGKEQIIPRCILPATKIKGLLKSRNDGRAILNGGPLRRGWKIARNGGDPYRPSFETGRSKSLRSAPREHRLPIAPDFSKRLRAVEGNANSLVDAAYQVLRRGLPAEVLEAVGLEVPIEVDDEDDDMNFFTPSSSMHTISMSSSAASLMSWRETTPEVVERFECVAQYEGRIPHFEEAVAPEISMDDDDDEVWYDASDAGLTAPVQVQQFVHVQHPAQVQLQPAQVQPQVQFQYAQIHSQPAIPPTEEHARLAAEADNILAELGMELAAAGPVPAVPTPVPATPIRPRISPVLLPVPPCPVKMSQRLYEDILAANRVQREEAEGADENPFIVQPVVATAGPSIAGPQDIFGVSDDEDDEDDYEEDDEEDEDEEFFDANDSGEGITHLKYASVPGAFSDDE